jgi:hypothetical protein
LWTKSKQQTNQQTKRLDSNSTTNPSGSLFVNQSKQNTPRQQAGSLAAQQIKGKGGRGIARVP